MKKILLASLMATFALTACQKDKEAEKPAEPAKEAATAPATTDAKADAHTEHEHKHGEHDKHDHEGHDHAHGDHDHRHHEGDKFQCGDKAIQIVVHDHNGKVMTHLTADDITYDLDQDANDKTRFITQNGIEGENKAMTLVLDGDKAQVLKADNSTLLDCTKAK